MILVSNGTVFACPFAVVYVVSLTFEGNYAYFEPPILAAIDSNLTSDTVTSSFNSSLIMRIPKQSIL